jgi:DNA polymerase-3 subunit delta'
VGVAKKTAKKAGKKASRKKRPAGALLKAAVTVSGPPVPKPIPLDEVLGQPRAIGRLDSAISSGRLHHAWVFHGPEGVGKFTTALAFAAAVLDPSSKPDLAGRVRPDPESQVQGLLRAGSHPDLHVVRKELASVSRSDQVRASKQTRLAKDVVEEFLIEPAAKTRVLPGESLAGKVFIVDEAHLLGIEAQNTLLKTMEEPPEGTVIVLVTPSEDRLLPTVRSRCQLVSFGTLDDSSMAAWARRAELDLSGVDAEWAFAFAGGSPGVLRAIAETGLGGWHAELQPSLDRLQAGGGVMELAGLLTKLVDEAAAAAVAGEARASKDVANRVAARRMFKLLGESFRGMMRRAAAVGRNDDAERAAACIGFVEIAERQMDSNVAMALVFENLAAQCAIER